MNTNQETENKIKRAFTAVAPDVLDSVLSDCKEQKGASPVNKNISSSSWLKPVLAIAAALVILISSFAGIYTQRTNNAVASTVMLDVNPSLEIQLNKNETVLQVIGRNEDGKKVIGNMDFSGSSLEVTVNALIGSMLRNGYISELSNSILISVEGKNTEASAALQARLTDEINQLLQTDTFNGAVLSQTISADDELQKQADTYGITLGKAQLIQQIIDQNPLHTFEELVSLSIHELNLISSSDTSPLEQVDSVGTASDKAYIGSDQALKIALSHAGLTADSIYDWSSEMDYELGALVYELEFHSGDYDYEYCIHAIDGSVVTHDKERCHEDDHHTETNRHENHHSSSGQNSDNQGAITETDALNVALSHAGVTADTVYDYECELDYDDGVLVYDIEFSSAGYDYDYEIDAASGAVRKSEKEKDDDILR